MELEQITALPVKELAEKDAVLFLWTTLPMIQEALQVIKAWGFEYKTTAFVWVKLARHSNGIFWGLGYWTRSNVEICMLATKGHPKRVAKNIHQVIISHVEEHRKSPPRPGGALRLLWAMYQKSSCLPGVRLAAGMYGEMRS
jgi:N6-adenosine-specific RNA methylase IME4